LAVVFGEKSERKRCEKRTEGGKKKNPQQRTELFSLIFLFSFAFSPRKHTSTNISLS
jgi:hypothetical protein